ncbi:MAG TPA: nucleotidyltransferase domain-containing protein [Candidatus Polarisedimenticolia bacterium]|nr:nucleotidyltransferase domain-containing protein [Candidatus Polarisedimenticolia bacterium]
MAGIETLAPDARAKLGTLASSLRTAFGQDLLSVVLYGSAARGDAVGEGRSDLNVVVIVKDLSLESLERATPVTRTWESAGNQPLLFFSPEWIDRSSDVFPLEFLDMREWHVVVEGTDPFDRLSVAPGNLRVQCESELKTKLIHLRTGYMELHQDGEALARLLAASYAPMVALCRGVLRLAGKEVPLRGHEAVRLASELCGFDPAPFQDVEAVKKGGARAASVAVKPLFRRYYAQVETMAKAVDAGWQDGARGGARS